MAKAGQGLGSTEEEAVSSAYESWRRFLRGSNIGTEPGRRARAHLKAPLRPRSDRPPLLLPSAHAVDCAASFQMDVYGLGVRGAPRTLPCTVHLQPKRLGRKECRGLEELREVTFTWSDLLASHNQLPSIICPLPLGPPSAVYCSISSAPPVFSTLGGPHVGCAAGASS